MSIFSTMSAIRENMPKVYAVGKEAQNKAFWDGYIRDGIPGLYAFAGYGWTDENFKPTRDIVASAENAEKMFYVSRIKNIKECLDVHGVKLDLSKATSVNATFQLAASAVIPEIDISSAINIGNCFNSANIKRIERVTLPSNASNSASAFAGCSQLEYIRIGGTIELSGLDFHWSTKLDADSFESIIQALSQAESGLTITLPSIAQTTYETKYGSGSWKTLTNTRGNWSIAYL